MSVRRIAWLVAALALAAGFIAIGRWQLERERWKTAYVEAYGAARAAAPVGFAAAAGSELPRRVSGSGRYDDAVTLLLDNRVRDGRPGVEVFTLFRPDGARPLLVDRGWMPIGADRVPPSPQPAGDAITHVAGLRIAPPSIGLALGELRFARGDAPPLWPRLDLESLAKSLGEPLEPAVVLLDDAAPHGFARAWRPLPNTLPPERHRAYAVQWFALAATVLVVALVMLVRRRA